MLSRRSAAILALAVMTAPCLAAQTPVNYAGWYEYQGTHPFVAGRPWGLMVEATIKRNDVVVDPMGLALRLGLDRRLPHGIHLAGGYLVGYNYPYDAASKPYDWLEQRLFEQVTMRFPLGRDPGRTQSHRFRMEQRWSQRKDSTGATTNWQFENTLGYTAKVNWPLTRTVHAILYDEIDVRLLPTDEQFWDQNRAFVGVGFKLNASGSWRTEVGYMYQVYWNSHDTQELTDTRINHTLRVTVISDAPLQHSTRP